MAGYEYHYAPAVMPDGRDMPTEQERRLQGKFKQAGVNNWEDWLDRLTRGAKEIGVEIDIGFDPPETVNLPAGWQLRQRDDGSWILVYVGENGDGEGEKSSGSTGSGSDSGSSSTLLFVGLAILLVVLIK